MTIISQQKESQTPAMAGYLGLRKIPRPEKIAPRTHTIKPSSGTQPTTKVTADKAKPAVPRGFLHGLGTAFWT